MTESNKQPAPWKFSLKDKLRRGERVVGATINVASAEIAAQCAAMGFDFLWLEMEHSPLHLESVRQMILASRGLRALPLVRPPVNELWTAKQALDAGAIGVIFPFVSSAEQARQAVAACRYPPVGLRGSGASLASAFWTEMENYYDFADQETVVVAIVENREGLANVDEIASVPGIDVLFIGTSDLSFSLGLRGKQDAPELKAAIAKIVSAGQRHGLPLGRPADTRVEMDHYQEAGFTFFQGPSVTELIAAGHARLLGAPSPGRD